MLSIHMMKLKHRWLFFIAVILSAVYVLFVLFHNPNNRHLSSFIGFKRFSDNVTSSKRAYYINNKSITKSIISLNNKQQLDKMQNEEIVVGVVVCRDRLTETLTMLKSAILFNMYTDYGLRIVIITEDKLNQNFSEKLGEWRSITNNSFEFEIHGLSFPTQHGDEWKLLFKPCAAQRLFLPMVEEYSSTIWNRERAYTTAMVEAVQFIGWLRWKIIYYANDRTKEDLRKELTLPLLSLRRKFFDAYLCYRRLHVKIEQVDGVLLRVPVNTTLLPHINKMLYVDTDVIFLAPLTELWDHFSLMNSTQMAALSPEHENPNIGWYNRFARHPYYGKMGVNSGVMLMHLSRMRQFGWVKYLAPIYKEFRLKLTWGDQDIINIFFHFHPERLLVYSCVHNYRTDHCMYLSTCPPAETSGVVVIHGSRGSFHGEKQPAFRAIYRAMEEYQLMTDAYDNLLLPMKSYLEQTAHTACGKLRNVFTKHMEAIITPAPVPALNFDDDIVR